MAGHDTAGSGPTVTGTRLMDINTHVFLLPSWPHIVWGAEGFVRDLLRRRHPVSATEARRGLAARPDPVSWALSCGLLRRSDRWGGNLQLGEHASRVKVALVP